MVGFWESIPYMSPEGIEVDLVWVDEKGGVIVGKSNVELWQFIL